MDTSKQKSAVWKHIGLYGHAVGTFTGKLSFTEICFNYFIFMLHVIANYIY